MRAIASSLVWAEIVPRCGWPDSFNASYWNVGIAGLLILQPLAPRRDYQTRLSFKLLKPASLTFIRSVQRRLLSSRVSSGDLRSPELKNIQNPCLSVFIGGSPKPPP
jgi:hypothetical protein